MADLEQRGRIPLGVSNGVRSTAEAARSIVRRWGRRAVLVVLPIIERLDRRLASTDLRVEWDARVQDVVAAIDDIVDDLGDRDAHRTLASVGGRTNVVVYERDQPIGALTLRRRPTFWEPTMYQCLAGPPLAIRQGRLEDVMRSVGVEIRIEGYAPGAERIEPDEQYRVDRYVADLTSDYEEHWQKKWRSNLRTTRNRCADFSLRVDEPGDVEWAVSTWHDAFADDPRGEVVAATDRLALWPQLVGSRIRTVALCDGDRVTACTVSSVRGPELTFQCTARDPEYDRFSAGSHVLDRTLRWAQREGYERFDLGAGYGYKQRFAPVAGTLQGIAFQPPLIRRARSVVADLR